MNQRAESLFVLKQAGIVSVSSSFIPRSQKRDLHPTDFVCGVVVRWVGKQRRSPNEPKASSSPASFHMSRSASTSTIKFRRGTRTSSACSSIARSAAFSAFREPPFRIK